eukprot:COSAG04_NODE_4295_length_2178_cov_1.260221_3_plen_155_part_00
MERSRTGSSSIDGGNSSAANGWNLTHYVRGECTASFCPPHAAAACSPDPEATGAQANGYFAPSNSSRWYWTENGLVGQGRLFIFAQTLSQPCSIGCNQVGIAFIEVRLRTERRLRRLGTSAEGCPVSGLAYCIGNVTSLAELSISRALVSGFWS